MKVEGFVGKAFWLVIAALLVVGTLVFFGKVGKEELYYVLGLLSSYITGKAALSFPNKQSESKS